jgi:hypothetical protein
VTRARMPLTLYVAIFTRRESQNLLPSVSTGQLVVVTTLAAVVAAAPAPAAAALELVDLFVQGVEFLLGHLTFALGFLECGHDAIEIAHNCFEAVADAIDLAAQDSVKVSISVAAASSAAITISVAITAAPIKASSFASAAVTASAAGRRTIFARVIAHALYGMFAIGFGALFVESFSFVRFVGGRFRDAFAFRSIVDCGWDIFVFVTGSIFAFAVIVVIGARGAIAAFFGRIVFARRTSVVTTTSAGAPAGNGSTFASGWTASASAATATSTITITWIAAFGARALGGPGRGSFGWLRFGVGMLGSGRRGGRRFPGF